MPTKNISDEQLTVELREALRSTETYPISIDDVSRWLLYRVRQRLVTILQTKFVRGHDFIELENSGTSRDDYKMFRITVDCFESFCKFRKGNRGRTVRALLIHLRESEFSSAGEVNSDSVNSPYESEGGGSASDPNYEDQEEESSKKEKRGVKREAEVPETETPRKIFFRTSDNNVLTISRRADVTSTPSICPSTPKPSISTASGTALSVAPIPTSEKVDEISQYHKKHMDELERTWLHQNEKIQKVVEKIDSPPFEAYWQISRPWDETELPDSWSSFFVMSHEGLSISCEAFSEEVMSLLLDI